MTSKLRKMSALAFGVPFLAVGIPYWLIPYGKAALPGSIIGFGLVVVAASAFALGLVRGARLWPTVLLVGASVPAAIMARVVYDVVRDPGTHNLWPFEIALCLVPGFAPALVGAVLGWLVQRFNGTE